MDYTKMDRSDLKTYLNSFVGKTVVRKSQTVKVLTPDDPKRYYKTRQATLEEKVRGIVKGYTARKHNGQWAVKLSVAWEGSTNGAIRWNGNKWNTTSELKIDSLIVLD